jgi:hypothetical protein
MIFNCKVLLNHIAWFKNFTYCNYLIFYELCMNAIMNERAHKGFMICYTNMDELTRLYEMLYMHS